MCKEIPLYPLEYCNNITDLDNFFGFCYAKIYCSENINIPLLPFKTETGETIYPTGCWYGTYFSEELKAVIPYGYKITLINGRKYSKHLIFNEYIKTFFEVKKYAVNKTEKFVAKMLLNQLYGYFGRSKELIITKNIHKKDLEHILTSRIVKTIIETNKDLLTVLISNNINYDILNKINSKITFAKIENITQNVKSNVAISAAVTAYGRIEMFKYKTLPGYKIYYTDTDSIFTNKPLPNHLIGNDLGQMKNELNTLNTLKIDKAYFLGNKKYGFQYTDKDTGELKIKSVFSGVKESLSWNQIEKLANGETIKTTQSNIFKHDFKTLNIALTNRTLHITKSYSKKLINNKYIPNNI
jgi:DNA polymerase type B, organellar and viral